MAKPIVAIMYDFDKTLSTTDMQNYTFIPNLGMTPQEFWGSTTVFSEKSGVERILSYMYMMILEARKKGIKLTKEYLNTCGKNIKFFPGVSTWFKRINEYGEEKGVKVEHYLVSSGTKEIIDGCSIIDEFTAAYGCEYYYDESGEPVWPKYAINYTQKTQFFFRIAKGVANINDDNSVNEKTPQLRIPYRNIVYLGDGMTDIACMTLVKKNGGRSIAVYPEKEINKVRKLYDDGRVSFICRSDYSSGSDLEKVMHLIIDSISTYNEIEKKQETLASK
ncbi:MAG: haloacid dehalogenase-like hydrolase [Bacilli bacterium]